MSRGRWASGVTVRPSTGRLLRPWRGRIFFCSNQARRAFYLRKWTRAPSSRPLLWTVFSAEWVNMGISAEALDRPGSGGEQTRDAALEIVKHFLNRTGGIDHFKTETLDHLVKHG